MNLEYVTIKNLIFINISIKFKMTSHEAYAVVSTYYKHGEYELEICYGESELQDYLIRQYYYYDEPEYKSEDLYEKTLGELIDIVTKEGELQIINQYGWGVREVKEI